MIGRTPKKLATRSVSQVPGFSGPICCHCFLGKRIEFAIMCVAFDGRVEAIGVKRFKPGTKPCQLTGRQLLDGLFDVFGCGHLGNIPSRKGREKPCRQ
jgi:hypothetical protein